jgi:hypothetical protein
MKKTLLSIITLATFSFGATAQNVSIPDANFKAYLLGNTAINTDADPNEISVNEASAFSGSISCSNLSISDFTGIEAFTALMSLDCSDNNISSLDVSQNTALTSLVCSGNNLNTLDVNQNTSLLELDCNNNSIGMLDVSQNTAVTILSCYENNLSSLAVNQNIGLTTLLCASNSINTLDISQNTDLTVFRCNHNNLTVLNMKNINTSTLTIFFAASNSLNCIDVDDVAASTSNWTNIDAGVNYSLNCQVDLVTSITVQGQGGNSTINILGGTLQMEASVLPTYADDDTYTWSVANGTGSATINASGLLTAITDGDVTVTATANDASGITGSTDITISNQSSVSINEQATIHSLSIYPNPVNSQLTINFDTKIGTIVILDIMGKTVKIITSSSNTIDVSDLTNGIYFLQLQTDKGLVSTRFIKE